MGALNGQVAMDDFQKARVLKLFLNSRVRRICQTDRKESMRLEAPQPLTDIGARRQVSNDRNDCALLILFAQLDPVALCQHL